MNVRMLSIAFALTSLSAASTYAQSALPAVNPSKSNAPVAPGAPVRPNFAPAPAVAPPAATGQAPVAAPVTAVPVHSMKMLTPTSGWASVGDRLLKTADGGATWTDISPTNPNDDGYASIFFLDPLNGWLLLEHSDDAEDWTFSLAATQDGGQTWQTGSLPEWTFDRDKGERGLVDQGVVAFSDPGHGWISLGIEGNTLFSSSALLVTSDGGRSWRWTADGPEGRIDAILAVDANDAWTISHPEGVTTLGVTHDGGNNFQEVALAAPAQISPDNSPEYQLPVFTSASTGYEAVTYSGPEGTKSASVLFATADGGVTWTVDRILSDLDRAEDVRSTMGGSSWVLPASSKGDSANVLAITPGTVTTVAPAHRRGSFGHCDISFATASNGWLDCDGHLQATSDGGSSWSDISPRARNGALTQDAISPQSEAARKLTKGPGIRRPGMGQERLMCACYAGTKVPA